MNIILALHALRPTECDKFIPANDIAAIAVDCLAHCHPGCRAWLTDVIEPQQIVLDMVQQILPASVCGYLSQVEFDDLFEIGKAFSQLRQIFDCKAVAELAIAIFDQQHRALAAKALLHPQPVEEIGMLPPRICHQQIDRTFGEEKLMGSKIDRLPAKIPDVDLIVVIRHRRWQRKLPGKDVDAFGAFLFTEQLAIGIEQLVCQ